MEINGGMRKLLDEDSSQPVSSSPTADVHGRICETDPRWVKRKLALSEAAPLLKLLFDVALLTVLLLLSYQLFVRHTPIGWLLNGRRRRAIHPTPDMM
jgi:hypothetical protein